MDKKLLESIDSFIEKNSDGIFRDIGRLVTINSVESAPEEGAPFGAGAKKALDLGLQIASELGLGTRNCEDRIGYGYVGEDSEEYLATITHLDIVPAGDGWKADPFVMRERDGYLIGRGVIDDKGPSVICLYALKYLKESGRKLKYPVRALLGTNEETGMGDVEYFLENYKAPLFCFSPDADFPLICGEKGIWGGSMVSVCAPENIVDIHGGFASNAIPGSCEATVKSAADLESTADVTAVKDGGLWHLTSRGIAGHASLPAGTKNAIGVMIDYLLANGVASEAEEKFLRFAVKPHHAYDGSLVGIYAESEGFTPNTVVCGMISVENGRFKQTIDIRYVPSVNGEWLLNRLKEAAGDAAEITCRRDAVPFYKAPDSPEIKACIDAYNFVTGEGKQPITIGGGTYARDFPNAVAFGPEHDDRTYPDFVGSMHGAEEAVSKAELLEALRVYILALINLEEIAF